MEAQRSLTGAQLAHRKPSEGAGDSPRAGAISWSRPIITRFGLERTLAIYGASGSGSGGRGGSSGGSNGGSNGGSSGGS
jgi:hypothetical protein